MCVTVLTLEKEFHWENTMQYYMTRMCQSRIRESRSLRSLTNSLVTIILEL